MIQFNNIDEAIQDIAHGKMIIVVDDENRENEGDFVMAAERVTPEAINFMAQHGRGLICATITSERAEQLHLSPMSQINNAHLNTAFTVSIDARKDITTGISAYDRALTIQLLTKANSRAEDFARPGHIFPIVSKQGGLLERPGHTEASVELAQQADLFPAGVICEIMSTDGTMARLPELAQLAQKHQLKIIHIQELIAYKKQLSSQAQHKAVSNLPTEHGIFKLHAFQMHSQSTPTLALVKGTLTKNQPILTRIHSECLTGELFESQRCDCGQQLQVAMQTIESHGSGIIVYLRQEGRGIGLINKIKAYQLQDNGYDTIEANRKLGFAPDLRNYADAANILHYFGINQIDLLTNNPNKLSELQAHGIIVSKRIPLEIAHNKINKKYLQTKKDKMGHMFSL